MMRICVIKNTTSIHINQLRSKVCVNWLFFKVYKKVTFVENPKEILLKDQEKFLDAVA